MSLHRLANFLIANVGNKITATKLRQPLSIGATSTILSWFSHLESSYLFSFMPMFSYSSKAQLINPRKIFLIDPALINILSGSKTEDKGRKLENLVFLHLRRNFSELYYYNEKAECDFVAFKNGKLVGLIQVCFNLDQDNVSREINGLLSAMKFFNVRTGVIVTMADTDRIVKDGCTIEVIPAFRFMGTAFGDNDRQPQV
jgi:predicted AAA+ superfamily ATPase